MAKSSRDKIKNDEGKILFELKKDSKCSIGKLAKHVGFSRQKVWRIVKRLESKKIIWGETAVYDESFVGMDKYVLLVKVNGGYDDIAEVMLKNEIIERLGIVVDDCFWMSGCYDYMLTFNASDELSAKKVCQTVNGLLSTSISSVVSVDMQKVLITSRNRGVDAPDAENMLKKIRAKA